MRKPHGYAILVDPEARGGPQEWDTITCHHCQRIVKVTAGQDPSEAGGFCRQCMTHLCGPCADLGTCTPFERKLDRYERAHRFHQAAGLVLR